MVQQGVSSGWRAVLRQLKAARNLKGQQHAKHSAQQRGTHREDVDNQGLARAGNRDLLGHKTGIDMPQRCGINAHADHHAWRSGSHCGSHPTSLLMLLQSQIATLGRASKRDDKDKYGNMVI